MNPLVSIIIPVYNTGAEAAALTEKLLKDKYENIEIILIDWANFNNFNAIIF